MKKTILAPNAHSSSHFPSRYPYYALSAFLWGGVIGVGYFYEIAFLMLDAALFCLLGIWIWRSGNQRIKITYWHLLIAGFVALYWISCIYAVDKQAAVLEASRFTCLVPISLFASSLTPIMFNAYFKQWALAGVVFTIGGWVIEGFRGGRLESTIGYANTLAMLLLTSIVFAWKLFKEKKSFRSIFYLLVSVIGLFQTGSRTVMMLFLLFVVYEWLQLREKRLLVWGGFGIAGLLLSLLSMTSSGLFERLANLNWNTSEFMTRRIYWSDGLKLLRAHWLHGYGGGGWGKEHPSWYFVKFIHQFYLQMWLEVGIAGLVLFLIIVGASIAKSISSALDNKRMLLFLAVAYLLHVAFDIDFEYPLCFGLFIIVLAALRSDNGQPLIEIHGNFRRVFIGGCMALIPFFGYIIAEVIGLSN